MFNKTSRTFEDESRKRHHPDKIFVGMNFLLQAPTCIL